MSDDVIHVVKLGGSLLEAGTLREMWLRFDTWRGAELGPRGVIVVGGGDAADIVRAWDRELSLGEERSHWLALRAMQLNAFIVAEAMECAAMVAKPQAAAEAWRRGAVAVVDPVAWLEREAMEGVAIPHRWTFTSDSVAAHIATRLGAGKLTLLKSTLPKGECGPACAAGLGIVDEDFPDASKGVPAIELINLRSQPVGRCVLR